jgi:5'-3' exonuclease
MVTTFMLDAYSLVYRAFYALPTSMADGRGRPVNAVRGFLDMTTRLIEDHHPDHMVAVYDNDWRPAFRVEAYPGYKAERPEEPPELLPQFEMLAEVLDALGIPRAEAQGLEADDVIATLVAGLKEGEDAVIVTGDRDLLCLVRDPNVRLLFIVRGVSQLRGFDEAEVEKAYDIRPQAYADFATLRGDPSDGLPGVRGVGPKRAAQLLGRYGSIDAILDNLDNLPPKLGAAFEEARDYLVAMKIVVPLLRDAAVEATSARAPDERAVEELKERYNLGGSITRLLAARKGSS